MVDFENVSMKYTRGAEEALTDVSFHVDPGEFVFVIGPSGSGKSTVIKLISCEERFQEGQIKVGNTKLKKIRRRAIPYLRRNIGMIFQDFRLIESKTVYENVAFAMEILGKSKRQIKRQVPIILSSVGLRHKQDDYPNELSGGEQQRVGIARAIVNNPSIILADEPTGNLDPDTSEQIMGVLKNINESGTTVIICTHDENLVSMMQERIIEINNGKLASDRPKKAWN